MQRLLCILAALAAASAFTVRYDNHQVWRFVPSTTEQLERLASLSNITHAYEDYDFWMSPRGVGRPVDIRVSPQAMEFVKKVAGDIPLNVQIEDLQAHFEQARMPAGTVWDQSYHSYEDIVTWLQNIAAANSSVATLINVGTTYQGRTIWGLKITKSTSGTAPQLYLDGGIHAREWMAPAVVEYIIGQFIYNSTLYDSYLKNYEWYLIPVWNCDGYVYTWTTDPNWRKNRQPNAGSNCIGTDPCRNADAGFGGPGSSSDPCNDEYHGPAAWSAPMTAAYRDYISKLPRLKTYVNFHSYAESWLDPYGYTAARPADYAEQQANGKNCTTAIKAVHGQTYAYGPAYTTIYPASGVPSDWVYDTLKVKISQAVELRGNSFQPPPNLIIPIGEEIMAGVTTLAYDVSVNP